MNSAPAFNYQARSSYRLLLDEVAVLAIELLELEAEAEGEEATELLRLGLSESLHRGLPLDWPGLVVAWPTTDQWPVLSEGESREPL